MNIPHPSASDVMQRAEKAARELNSTYHISFSNSDPEFAREVKSPELAAIIARHFEDVQRERDHAFAYIKSIWGSNQLPAPLGHRLHDALVAETRSVGQLVLAATAPESLSTEGK